ncbi:MAG: peptide chain release factor N(5)-glutamine methyltransferase [Bacteroidota bacterium]
MKISTCRFAEIEILLPYINFQQIIIPQSMKGLKNNTLAGVFEWFCQGIAEKYEPREARAIGGVVFEEMLGFSAVDLQVNRGWRISESDIVNLYRVLKKLNNDVPLQHITGVAHFRDLVLKVNGDVLIPRPETEELVQWILDDIAEKGRGRSLRIWDIGTGSGAIALSLATELQGAEVLASDVSEKALAIARENSMKYITGVQFLLHDILNDAPPEGSFDIIVSNPPYVRESEKPLIRNNVLLHDPHLALFVPDHDPLKFYRSIGETALTSLSPHGFLYLEINEALGMQTVELLLSIGFSQAKVKRDLFGKDRMVRAVL